MSKKNNSSTKNKDRASNLSPDSVDAQIHGNRAGSSADKARGKVTTTGLERVHESSQSAPPTSSRTHTTETRGLSRSTEVATGGIANRNESAVTKAEDLVDAVSDELYLDSDRRQQVVASDRQKSTIKPSDLKLLSMHRSMALLPDRVPTRHVSRPVPLVSRRKWGQIRVAPSRQHQRLARSRSTTPVDPSNRRLEAVQTRTWQL